LPHRTWAMQDPASELPRILLMGSWCIKAGGLGF
jgi:hypothetical protein